LDCREDIQNKNLVNLETIERDIYKYVRGAGVVHKEFLIAPHPFCTQFDIVHIGILKKSVTIHEDRICEEIQ
jgi:hypothetical protein